MDDNRRWFAMRHFASSHIPSKGNLTVNRTFLQPLTLTSHTHVALLVHDRKNNRRHGSARGTGHVCICTARRLVQSDVPQRVPTAQM